MLKFSMIAVFFVLVAVGSYGTEAGRAANAALGQAVLDQGAIVTGTMPNDTVANR